MWHSITQQLSGTSRGHKAKLVDGRQKTLEWSLPEVLSKTEESAHFKVCTIVINCGFMLLSCKQFLL